MSKNRIALTIFRVASGVPRLASRVADDVVRSMEDGVIDADEAQKIAAKTSTEAGDVLKVKVNGYDVVDDKAQKHLAKFLGRVVARTVTALKREDPDA